MIEKVRKFSRENHDVRGFEYHIVPVLKNALLLGKKLNADLKVLEAAALLHDIANSEKVRGKFLPEDEHHVFGAKIAGKFLQDLKCSEEFIKKVEHCVLAHRGRKEIPRKSLEAEIIANADAMSHFEAFLYLFFFFTTETGYSFEKAVAELEKKMQRDWNQKLTLPEAKKLIKPKYQAVKLLIESMKDCVKS